MSRWIQEETATPPTTLSGYLLRLPYIVIISFLDLLQPMNWTPLIGPAVVAAVISSLVSAIGIWISARTSRSIHTEKLAFEREQVQHKVTADIALAEKKLTLDRAFAAWKRRTQFAEEVLADFYRARDIVNGARSPAVFEGEGATRRKEDWETERDTQILNGYFAVAERLSRNEEFFAQLWAKRYRFLAIFSLEAAQPYEELFKIRTEVAIAVKMLVTTHQDRRLGSLPTDRREWEQAIGWVPPDADKIRNRLDAIVDAIETLCRPIIQDVKQ